MNLALFGGTFDPVHHGHLAVARAAAERFHLKQVLLVPSSRPPHRHGRPLSPYHHRLAMLALAAQGEELLVPSDLEAPAPGSARPSYSLDTVRRLKRRLGSRDRLYFLIGIDAFLDIAQWHQPDALLRQCDFIVASRPGYSLADVGGALPAALRPSAAVFDVLRGMKAAGTLALRGATIHLLENVKVNISATQVRAAAAARRPLRRLVPPAVEEYIRKAGLYR